MKSSRATALLPILSFLLAPICAAQVPANLGESAKEATDNSARQETAVVAAAPILVIVDKERKVFFRKEQVGTSDNVGPLKERVRQAIERNRQAARDKGDAEAAKSANTVFICAPPELKYRDVVKIVDAIKEAGGSPVGLYTDSGCDPSRKKSKPPASVEQLPLDAGRGAFGGALGGLLL